MRLFLRVVLTLCFAVGLVFPALASQRIALVIGNSDYEYAPLANPVRDAALMAETLREVGFEVLEYNDLDRRDLTKAFITLGKKLEDAGSDATALVYYAGHGAQVNGENYLIPVGARIEEEIDVEIEGVRASSLLGTLRRAKSALNIVILDACRNNPFESSGRSATRGLAKMDAPTGTLLAYSTAPGKVAEDGAGNNSTYTKALARAIKTPGAKVEEVFKTVRVSVVDRTQGRQVPWESSSLTGDFIFQEKLPEPEPVVTASTSVDTTQIEIEYWKSIATSTNPALFEAYLAEYPEGLFRSIAEQRVASLSTAPVETQQDDGFAREQAVWNSIKDSGNIGMLQGFLESFPDGVYATIARSTIADLQNQQQVASVDRAQGVHDEGLIWDSVKDARTAGELQVYLDAYPNGRFAAVAKAKIAALNSALITHTVDQPASDAVSTPLVVTPANPDYPFDGTWQITGQPKSFRGAYRFGICHNTDSVSGSVEIRDGEVTADMTSKLNNSLVIGGTANKRGELALEFATSGGPGYTARAEYTGTHAATSPTIPIELDIRSSGLSGCKYTFTMTRAVPHGQKQVASLTPSANEASNPQFPFDGIWRVTGEPVSFIRSFRYGVCQNGDLINDTFEVRSGEVRANLTSQTRNVLGVEGSISSNGRLELNFNTGGGQSQNGHGQFRGDVDTSVVSIPMRIKLESGHGAGCRYDLTMKREAAALNNQVASVSRSQGVHDEDLIWESVRDAKTVGELQVYLDAYPNGRFAAVARAKIAALSAPVLNTGAGNNYQGKWRFELVYESARGSLPTAFCSPGAKIETDISIDSSGSFKKDVESNKNTKQTISGQVNQEGRLQFNLFSWAGARGPAGDVNIPFPEGELSNRIKLSSTFVDCIYRMRLSRAQ